MRINRVILISKSGERIMSKVLIRSLFVAAVVSLAPPVMANEVEPVYGGQLMTQEERQAHQAQMRNASSAEERERIRQKNHEKMRLRAKEKGVPFSDQPPEQRGHVNQKDRSGMGSRKEQ